MEATEVPNGATEEQQRMRKMVMKVVNHQCYRPGDRRAV